MKSKLKTMLLVILSVFFIVPLLAQSDIPQRSDIADEYKWNLADIYPAIEDWEKDFQFVENSLPKFAEFKGKLGRSGKEILKCFKMDEKISIALDNLYVYAYLQKDSDTRVSESQAYADRVAALYTKYTEAVAYIEPELQEIPEDKLNKYISKTDGLEIYRHYFDNMIRQRAHTLSENEEQLLAMAGELYRAQSKIYELPSPTNTNPGKNKYKILIIRIYINCFIVITIHIAV